MRADVKWTNLSRRPIARRMEELGTPVSRNIVSRLLFNDGFRRRNPQEKRTIGWRADRNAQFEDQTGVSRRGASGDQHRHEKEGIAGYIFVKTEPLPRLHWDLNHISSNEFSAANPTVDFLIEYLVTPPSSPEGRSPR